MRTLYDWAPGARGDVLKPRGVDSRLATIVLGANGGDLEQIYRDGRLTGRALKDARLKFEGGIPVPRDRALKRKARP